MLNFVWLDLRFQQHHNFMLNQGSILMLISTLPLNAKILHPNMSLEYINFSKARLCKHICKLLIGVTIWHLDASFGYVSLIKWFRLSMCLLCQWKLSFLSCNNGLIITMDNCWVFLRCFTYSKICLNQMPRQTIEVAAMYLASEEVG